MINPSFKEYLPSYYVSTVNPHPSYPTLEGRLKTETCVIGGGLTGLCTALPLAENGHEVIVLEAARIGFGASGRSGGQVISDFACSMEEIEKQVGLEQAQWFWQQSLQAVELVDSRIQKHNIQCDWQRGYATVAVRPQHWEELQQWHEHAQKHYGASHYQLWDKATLKQQLASDMYQGAQFDPLSGHLHPLNYTLGIAKAAADAGAQLFEQSPMTRIEPCDNGWLVHTPNGSVECKNLVYAVNTYAGLHPKFKVLEQKAIAVSTFIIATEPLGERAKDLIRNNMAICDNRHILDYYRLSADGRLLFWRQRQRIYRRSRPHDRTRPPRHAKSFPTTCRCQNRAFLGRRMRHYAQPRSTFRPPRPYRFLCTRLFRTRHGNYRHCRFGDCRSHHG